MEWNNLCNFGGRYYGEHNYFIFGQVVQEVMLFIFSSGGHVIQGFVQIMGNIYLK